MKYDSLYRHLQSIIGEHTYCIYVGKVLRHSHALHLYMCAVYASVFIYILHRQKPRWIFRLEATSKQITSPRNWVFFKFMEGFPFSPFCIVILWLSFSFFCCFHSLFAYIYLSLVRLFYTTTGEWFNEIFFLWTKSIRQRFKWIPFWINWIRELNHQWLFGGHFIQFRKNRKQTKPSLNSQNNNQYQSGFAGNIIAIFLFAWNNIIRTEVLCLRSWSGKRWAF